MHVHTGRSCTNDQIDHDRIVSRCLVGARVGSISSWALIAALLPTSRLSAAARVLKIDDAI